MEDIFRPRVTINLKETASDTWSYVPFQSSPANLILTGNEHTTPSTAMLWCKAPQWLSQESSSWPTTEVDTPTDILEIRNVHVALLQPSKVTTQRFSKFNKLIRVIAKCRRFINKCRSLNANKKMSTLSTQNLDQALTCCVKMIQQISYEQEMKDLMECQEVAATRSLTTLHPFIDQEGIIRVEGRLQESTLTYQIIHQMNLPSNHHFSRLVVSAEHTRLHHAMPQLLIASLHQKYWIQRIRNLVKTFINV